PAPRPHCAAGLVRRPVAALRALPPALSDREAAVPGAVGHGRAAPTPLRYHRAKSRRPAMPDDRIPPAGAHPQHVDPAYRHGPKPVTPQPLLELRGARLKWYDLARAATPVPDAIHALARDYLVGEAKAGRLGLEGDIGFVVLHRCENEFYFLIVSTWRGNNELWESVYYKQNAATPGFSLFPRESRHKGTYCVWERGPVWHEQQAWVRFLTSPRAAASPQAYLDDRFSGSVG